jgi:hypothetical protein
MRPALPAALLLMVACSRPGDGLGGSAAASSAECRLALYDGVTNVDVLFVVDDSTLMATLQPRIQAEIGRVVDEQMSFDRGDIPIWYHFGVISADPADGARLRGGSGGCSIADDRPYVDYLRGGISNLEPGASVGGAVGCLAAAGSAGAAGQQPMTQAARLLGGGIDANRDFRRRAALFVIVFLLGDSYAESGDPLLAALGPRGDFILASLAPPSPELDRVMATERNPAQLPPDATDWSPLFAWDKGRVQSQRQAPCLVGVSTTAGPDSVVVTDVTTHADGTTTSMLVPACAVSDGAPPCWTLATSNLCTLWQGVEITVRRPPGGPPPGTAIRVSYSCG